MPRAVPTHGPTLRERRRVYDATARDREAKRFYRSSAWQKLRAMKLAQDPACEDCLEADRLEPATTVHHVVEIRDDPSKRLDLDNLRSLCASCHAKQHRINGCAKSNG